MNKRAHTHTQHINRRFLIRHTIIQIDTIKVMFNQSKCFMLTVIIGFCLQAYRQ